MGGYEIRHVRDDIVECSEMADDHLSPKAKSIEIDQSAKLDISIV